MCYGVARPESAAGSSPDAVASTAGCAVCFSCRLLTFSFQLVVLGRWLAPCSSLLPWALPGGDLRPCVAPIAGKLTAGSRRLTAVKAPALTYTSRVTLLIGRIS